MVEPIPEEGESHLREISSKDRIKLVQNDNVRRWGQIIISFILIGSMISYISWYTLTQSDPSFKLSLANDMRVLVIMGVGAALAIFGLGRTVGKK